MHLSEGVECVLKKADKHLLALAKLGAETALRTGKGEKKA
jgi:hypothetical protein